MKMIKLCPKRSIKSVHRICTPGHFMSGYPRDSVGIFATSGRISLFIIPDRFVETVSCWFEKHL